MKITRLFVALCLCFCLPALYAQQTHVNKGIFSFGISMSDYNFRNYLKYDMAPTSGLGVQATYWKPVARRLDFSGNLGVVLSNLPAGFVKSDSVGHAGVSLHSDALIHLRAFARNARVNPFISAGAGWGSFGYQKAFYAPVGAGVTVHFNPGSIIIFQGQMRESLSRSLIRNFIFYSVSFACDIPGTKPKKQKSHNDEVVKYPKASGNSPSPDSDGDGISDEDDKCLQIKGSSENEGCPFPLVKGADVVAMSADSVTCLIYFDYDRAELGTYDFGILNAIMQILKADKALTIHISGYADMQEPKVRNMQMSADRAKVTRDYFLSYNVSASRIASSYYGSRSPIDNVRQWRNRRAEVTIIRH